MSIRTNYIKENIRSLEIQLESAKNELAQVQRIEARQAICGHEYPRVMIVGAYHVMCKCSTCAVETKT